MVYFNLALNLSIQQTYVPAGAELTVATQGYLPLLEVLESHPRQRATFFVDGITSHFLLEELTPAVHRIRKGIEDGRFEVGTYTYSHPILSLIPFDDTLKQLEKGVLADEQTWGMRPKGLLLPEGGWDPSVPHLLNELNLEWLIIPHLTIVRDFPNTNFLDFHRPFRLEGIFNSEVLGLSTVYEVGDKARLMEVMTDAEDGEAARSMLGYITRLSANRTDNLICIVKEDGEFIYHSGKRKEIKKYGTGGERNVVGQPLVDGVEPQVRRFDQFLTKLEQIEGIEFSLLQPFLARNPPTRKYALRPAFGWYKSFQEWLGGSEKIGYLIDEARLEIKAAEYAVVLAQKLGFDTLLARQTIQKAWDSLLNAEISVGRRACAHPLGEVSRVTKSLEDAVTAKKLAAKSVEDALQWKGPQRQL